MVWIFLAYQLHKQPCSLFFFFFSYSKKVYRTGPQLSGISGFLFECFFLELCREDHMGHCFHSHSCILRDKSVQVLPVAHRYQIHFSVSQFISDPFQLNKRKISTPCQTDSKPAVFRFAPSSQKDYNFVQAP